MAVPKFNDVLYEETGGVATVTLNRPDRLNAIRVGMYEEITEALCDLAIASEIAQFEQVGPKVGAVDPVFGTALLARIVGQKKAREMWYLCRRYSARQALEMVLVKEVVPDAELDAEVERWCAERPDRSPTAIGIAFQRRQRADPWHLRPRFRGGRTLLPHRRGKGGGSGAPPKTQAEVPLTAALFPAGHDTDGFRAHE